jgi:hypothetical protein
MGGGHAKGSMEPQHYGLQSHQLHPIRLLFRAEAVLPEEIKHQSLRTTAEAPPCPNKAEEKDLLELERLKAVTNLQKYQDETRSWRDPKVKKRDFDVGNLVLLWSPYTESSGKL